MSERGTELLTKASRQLSEMTEFFATLNEYDLRKPCPDRDVGDTVGALAAHMAEGYHNLGQLLRAAGHLPGPPATGRGHGHSLGPGAATLPDLLKRLADGKAPISLLASLTAEQLDSVPPSIPHVSDGRRTLEGVIDDVIAHQAAHLATLRQAVS